MAGFVVVFFIVLVLCLSPNPSANDIQTKCVGHQGVQQIIDTTWGSVEGRVTVVCKDGSVRKVT